MPQPVISDNLLCCKASRPYKARCEVLSPPGAAWRRHILLDPLHTASKQSSHPSDELASGAGAVDTTAQQFSTAHYVLTMLSLCCENNGCS